MASKNINLEIGTLFKKTSNGAYYYRYQVNGQRKAISLKTKIQKEAIAKAEAMIPVIKASNIEVISAHVKYAKGLALKQQDLKLCDAWEIYIKNPDRAMPATVSEQNSYKATFTELCKFVNNTETCINDITPEVTDQFAQSLRKQDLAVDTHNRKIRRLKKIFEVLKDYRDAENPFIAKSLKRKEREEQGNTIKRLSFSREQESQLLEVLDDDKYKVMNKPEVKVAYYIGMFTGQRFKDCVLLQWNSVDLKRRRIWVKQFKTGKEVTIPISQKLLDVLIQAEGWKVNNYVCPHIAERYLKKDSNGKNVGNNLVNKDSLRPIKWIGLEPSVKVEGRKRKTTVFGFHSLRHSFVSHCAEAGVPKAVVLSIIGTNSEIVDKHYTHIGDEAQEKAIAAISGSFETSTISDSEKINKIKTLIANLEIKSDLAIEIEQILR